SKAGYACGGGPYSRHHASRPRRHPCPCQASGGVTEEEARAWIADQFAVSRETWARLERFVAMLLVEMERQNLIAESTRPHVWARHIVDSAQLLTFTGDAPDGQWIDLGSGAGLPAIVVALLTDRPILMVESRRKRIDFLQAVVDELGLRHAAVFAGR